MLCIAGRQAGRMMAGRWAIPAVVAPRRRQFSSTPSISSTSDKSNGVADISGYTDQLSNEAEYPLILKVMQASLESIHDGPIACPWWGVIAGSAFALRAGLMLPVYIYQQRAQARARKLAGISKLWYRPMRTSLELELATRTPPVTDKEFGKLLTKRLSRRHHLLMFRQGCHPIFSVLLPMTQIPIWMSMTFCLRHLSGRLIPLLDSATATLPTAAPDMASEGILWFTNLVATDSTGMLPAITGLVYLANALVQLYRRREYTIANFPDGAIRKETWFTRTIPYLGLVAPPVITYAAMFQPSAIVLYWLASSSFTLAQKLVFHNQKLRKQLKFNYIEKKAT
ncbi:hypothetical protein H4S07_000506 [Coemansia furcata]|uniref:Uncharacterized protein n=1 Tax=Coemansia furcata TaxID=417177 RepID=A0ACC1LS31_9FUNG|nr:hypothetical protein H4S07_000506 [Coemansia furcata]